MSPARTESIVAHLAWDAVARRLEDGAAAILPIGAGAKEHGLHLPMDTDQVQAEWLAERLAEQVDALVWPTLTYGHYPAFVRYAGSVSLSADTFESVVREIVEGLLGFGADPVLVVDTGISTMAPVERALASVTQPPTVRHLKVHDGPRYRRVAERITEQTHGSHADELETSRMLLLAPGLIDMSRAQASPMTSRAGAGPLEPRDARSSTYSPSGSYGDPTLASSEKGDLLLAAMVDDLVDAARAAISERTRSGVLREGRGRQKRTAR